jgi:hypothetical protein
MKDFYYVCPTKASEADACGATFVAAKVILSAQYQQHSTSPFMLSLSKHVPLFFNRLLSLGLPYTSNSHQFLGSPAQNEHPNDEFAVRGSK